MKLISIILVIIIAGFTLIPCDDDANDHSDQQGILVPQDGDLDGHADFDFCSPLCSCHCCHSHITPPVFLSFITDIQYSQEFSSYYEDHLSSIFFPIWQPPKIA
jgi:hypothetical protein